MKLRPVVNLINNRTPTHPIYRFLAGTSTNIRTNPQKFHAFSFNSFARLVSNFKAIPSASSKLLKLNQKQPLKERFFGSNPDEIEVMIISLIEMRELLTTSTT